MAARAPQRCFASMAVASTSRSSAFHFISSPAASTRPSLLRYASSLPRSAAHRSSGTSLSGSLRRTQQTRAYSLWPFPSAPAVDAAAQASNDAARAQAVSSVAGQHAAAVTPSPVDAAASASSDLASQSSQPAADLSPAIVQATSETTSESTTKAVEAGQHLLSDFGEGQTFFVGNIQKILVGVHDLTGLPWWLSIPVTILTLRLFLLYPVGKLLAHSHRFAKVQPQMTEIASELKAANQTRDVVAMQEIQSRSQQLMKAHNVNPLKLLALPAIQAPLFIGLFFALKRMANAGWPDFKDGGAFWFTDLTLADPTWYLPAISSVMTLATFELGADFGNAASANDQNKRMRWGIRGVMLASFYFMANLPAAVFVYWVTQNTLSLAQLFLIRTPIFRRIFGMPELEKKKGAAATPAQAKPKPAMNFADSVKAGFELGTPPAAAQSGPQQSAHALPTTATPSLMDRATGAFKKQDAQAPAPAGSKTTSAAFAATNAPFQAKTAKAGLGKGKQTKGQNKHKSR